MVRRVILHRGRGILSFDRRVRVGTTVIVFAYQYRTLPVFGNYRRCNIQESEAFSTIRPRHPARS